jgi:hypothetical protein
MKPARVPGLNLETHGKRCACPYHDPDQKLLAAARAKALADQHATAAAVAAAVTAPPAPPRAMPPDRYRAAQRRADHDPETRRFRELVRGGCTAAEAIAKIESEKTGGIPNGKA